MSMYQRFVEIPFSILETATLNALLEAFITRQGNATETTDIQAVTQQLHLQLQQGQLLILHDIETATTEIMTQEQARNFMHHLPD